MPKRRKRTSAERKALRAKMEARKRRVTPEHPSTLWRPAVLDGFPDQLVIIYANPAWRGRRAEGAEFVRRKLGIAKNNRRMRARTMARGAVEMPAPDGLDPSFIATQRKRAAEWERIARKYRRTADRSQSGGA